MLKLFSLQGIAQNIGNQRGGKVKQFLSRLLQQGAIKLLLWASLPILGTYWFYFREQFAYAYAFMSDAPKIVWAAVLLAPTLVAVALVAGIARYVLSTDSTSIDPRWRRWWDALSYRRILIDTGSLFSYGRLTGVYCLPMLHFTVKVRRGKAIQLKACYLENLRTGTREDLLFSGPGPSMPREELQQIRPQVLVCIHSRQHDWTMEQFLDQWDGFKIVLAYDNSIFEREYPFPVVLEHLSKLWLHHHSANRP